MKITHTLNLFKPKISAFNFSHHVKVINKTRNRSDHQDDQLYKPIKLKPERQHDHDEIYTKGKGGNEFVVPKDKEGLKDNFNQILDRTISSRKPHK
jgi:hypothetical protein